MKSPLELKPIKIDFPAMQIEESYNTIILAKNASLKDIIFEFFTAEFEICGIKITPMVGIVMPNMAVEINIEYSSFFKKIGAFTIKDIKNKNEKDPKKNFSLRLKEKF